MPGNPESVPPAWPMYSRCKHNWQSPRSTPSVLTVKFLELKSQRFRVLA